MAREERADFAAFLRQLPPEQWDKPSLCERWTVRDVVAHTVSYDELTRPELVRRFLRGRLMFNRINQVGVDDYANRSVSELVDVVERCIEPRGLTAGFGGMIALVDGMIHHQDIRRALDVPRTIPEDRLHRVLDYARYVPVIRGAWRARRLKLVADDLDWSFGFGPEVRGPGEALLMAMAGRPSAVGDLTGPGQPVLARRLGFR